MTQLEKYESALRSISNLWPQPPHCAEINPEWVGENDGKQRAILLEAAIKDCAESSGVGETRL